MSRAPLLFPSAISFFAGFSSNSVFFSNAHSNAVIFTFAIKNNANATGNPKLAISEAPKKIRGPADVSVGGIFVVFQR